MASSARGGQTSARLGAKMEGRSVTKGGVRQAWRGMCAACAQQRRRLSRCSVSHGTEPRGAEANPRGLGGEVRSQAGRNHVDVLMREQDIPKLVSFFRQASPYISQHWGKTFVIVLPGYITANPNHLDKVLKDVATLHGLGVRVVLVVGTSDLIDRLLAEAGEIPKFSGGYRMTDAVSLDAAIKAVGAARIEVEAKLSQCPPASMTRRHGYSQSSEKNPFLQVISGNFVAAKRRGVVDGVDMGYTGDVKNIYYRAVLDHLDDDYIVVLNNLGYNVSGEVLNCSVYDVAMEAARALQADKLIIYHGPKLSRLSLPKWLSISDSHDATEGTTPSTNGVVTGDLLSVPEIALALGACKHGVPRTHLIEAAVDGSLFLELYTRDGIGTMVSRDLYEGMRPADLSDVGQVATLLKPLEEQGTLVRRTREEIERGIEEGSFVVVEREGKVIGCCMVSRISSHQAELSAFVVQEQFRTERKGDALLDYAEQLAREMGIKTLFLMTTRTSDWFTLRGFQSQGTAHTSPVLPAERKAKIDPTRNSMLYAKELDQGSLGPAGSRIGY